MPDWIGWSGWAATVLALIWGYWAWRNPRQGRTIVSIDETPIGLPNDRLLAVTYDHEPVDSPTLVHIRMRNPDKTRVEFAGNSRELLKFAGQAEIRGILAGSSPLTLISADEDSRPKGFVPQPFLLGRGKSLEFLLLTSGLPHMDLEANVNFNVISVSKQRASVTRLMNTTLLVAAGTVVSVVVTFFQSLASENGFEGEGPAIAVLAALVATTSLMVASVTLERKKTAE